MKDYEEGRWFQHVPCEGFTHFTRIGGRITFFKSQESAEGWVGAHLADVKEAGASVKDGEILVGQILKASKNVRVDHWSHVRMLPPGEDRPVRLAGSSCDGG